MITVEALAICELEELIGKYFLLGYAEGAENRSHDTEDGAAQRTLSEIQRRIRRHATPQPAYDRELIATMLFEVAGAHRFTAEAIRQQIDLLRAADNADAAAVRTVSRPVKKADEHFDAEACGTATQAGIDVMSQADSLAMSGSAGTPRRRSGERTGAAQALGLTIFENPALPDGVVVVSQGHEVKAVVRIDPVKTAYTPCEICEGEGPCSYEQCPMKAAAPFVSTPVETTGVASNADAVAGNKPPAPYTPSDGKVACPIPTCRAELRPSEYCGGAACGLRPKLENSDV